MLKVMKVITVAAHDKVIVVTDLHAVTDLRTVIDHLILIVILILIVLHTVVKVSEAEEVLGAGRVIEVQGAEKVTEPEEVVGRDRGIVLIHHRIVLQVVAVVITQIESRPGGVIVLMMTIMITSRCLHRLLNA